LAVADLPVEAAAAVDPEVAVAAEADAEAKNTSSMLL
jgi:hypothetical protein